MKTDKSFKEMGQNSAVKSGLSNKVFIIAIVLAIAGGCTVSQLGSLESGNENKQAAMQESPANAQQSAPAAPAPQQPSPQQSPASPQPAAPAVNEKSDKNTQQILAENVKSQSSAGQQNSPPTIMITEPDSNEVITGQSFTIWWKAEDPNNDKLLVKLEYSSGGSMNLMADNIENDRSFLWDTSSLANGEYTLRATVTDGSSTASASKSFKIQK